MSASSSITRREVLGAATTLAAAHLTGASPAEGSEDKTPRRRPNLLFVFSDQHSWDMLGCYGNAQVRSPELDRFAGEGVRFNHCISNSPVCTPFRAMLMSGQHVLYNGCIMNDWQLLPGRGKHIGEVLRDAGYRTGYVGKWHLYGGNRRRPVPAGPHRHGFDDTFLTNNCHVNYKPGACFYWNAEGKKVLFDDWEQYGQTTQALSFLDECKADLPFALFVSWHPPHNHCGWNYPAPADLEKLYDPAKMRLRPNCPDTPRNRRWYAGYMALVTSIDRTFGWLMKKLRDKGLADDTLVVFTADHGDLLNSHGTTGCKCRPEHESCRVPLMIRLPGKLKPRTSDMVVGTLDLMPTVLGLMGMAPPETCQGRDLAPTLLPGSDTPPLDPAGLAGSQCMFIIPGVGWRGVYTRDWTYSYERAGGRRKGHKTAGRGFNLLLDNRNDPDQRTNLFGRADHRATQKRLHEMTCAWMKRFGDKFVDYPTLVRTCLKQGPLPLNHPKATGEVKGRPIDLLGKS